MAVMIRVLFSRRDFISVGAAAVLCGILLAAIEISPADEISLESAYLLARDGFIEMADREYSADAFNCLLNILIFIPFIGQIFIADYDTAKAFVFVRLKNISMWYNAKILQSFVYCLYAEAVYNVTLLVMALLMGFRAESAACVFKYLVYGISAGFLILFMVCTANHIVCTKAKPHLITALFMGLTVTCMLITHLLTDQLIQFNIFTNYFFTWHMKMNSNSAFYYYPTWKYYAAVFLIIITELFAGRYILKKSDSI